MGRDTASSSHHHQMGVLPAKHSEPWAPCSPLGQDGQWLPCPPLLTNPIPLLGAKGTHSQLKFVVCSFAISHMLRVEMDERFQSQILQELGKRGESGRWNPETLLVARLHYHLVPLRGNWVNGVTNGVVFQLLAWHWECSSLWDQYPLQGLESSGYSHVWEATGPLHEVQN